MESAYEACLKHELIQKNLNVDSQVTLPIIYKGTVIDAGYRIDLLVEDILIVELKATGKILPIHEAQLLSYLKMSDKKVGLILNFNVMRLKHGRKRLAN